MDIERRLAAAGVPSPAADAAALLSHVLGIPRTRLILQDRMDEQHRIALESLVARRCNRVPLQHILGRTGFRRLEVAVGPGVFVPRPETEIVADAAIRALREAPDRVAVDLCAGTGVIALALATEVPSATVHAVELSAEALPWLRANAAELAPRITEVGSQLQIHADDATTCATGSLAFLAGQVAVVASNPPYIPVDAIPRDPEVRFHDPAMALYAGPDGLEIIRSVIETAAVLLRPGGTLVMEHADAQGAEAGARGVPGLLRADARWTQVRDLRDYNSLPRFTVATRVVP
jgi:release factor glutamine methyltransferase